MMSDSHTIACQHDKATPGGREVVGEFQLHTT